MRQRRPAARWRKDVRSRAVLLHAPNSSRTTQEGADDAVPTAWSRSKLGPRSRDGYCGALSLRSGGSAQARARGVAMSARDRSRKSPRRARIQAMGFPPNTANTRNEAKDVGLTNAFAFGIRPAYIRTLSPGRDLPLVALSGDPEDIARTDAKMPSFSARCDAQPLLTRTRSGALQGRRRDLLIGLGERLARARVQRDVASGR